MTRDRVVLLTPPFASSAVCEEMPAIAAAISDFRSQFDVEIFLSSLVRGGTPADSYEEFVAALCAKLSPGCHIVAMASGAVGLLAADRRDDVGALVISGLTVPPATFRAMGMAAAAEASEAMCGAIAEGRGMIDLVARSLEDAPDDVARRLLALVDRDLDPQSAARFMSTFARINLLEVAPRITAPTLFLEPQPAAVTVGAREVILRLVPDAVVAELEAWPTRLHEKETGHEFAQKAIAFIDRHSRRSE